MFKWRLDKMDNSDRIKQLERIGVSPDNTTNYTDGIVNPYRSVALAMIERGEAVPNDLVEQINYFDGCKVNTQAEVQEDNVSSELVEQVDNFDSESDIQAKVHENRELTIGLNLMPVLIMLMLITVLGWSRNTLKENTPYNRITEFVSRYNLSIPEDKITETIESIDSKFKDNKIAVVELIDANGNINTYALDGTYVYRGAVQSEKFTGIFKVKDDGSYETVERQVEN